MFFLFATLFFGCDGYPINVQISKERKFEDQQDYVYCLVQYSDSSRRLPRNMLDECYPIGREGTDPARKCLDAAERLDSSTFRRMDGLHHVRNMKSALNFLVDIYHELEDEGFEPDEILEFFTMKMEQKLGGRTR